MSDEPVIVARVARAHGLNGGLLLDSETDVPEALFQRGRRLRVVGAPPGLTEVEVAEARPHSGRWLVRMEGVTDRTSAEALRGASLTVPRSELPDLPEGAFLLHDLIGLTVVDGGVELGLVREVYDLPAGPMLSVEVDGRERMIPLNDAIIDEIDLATEAIYVTLPEGLLDI